MLQVLAYCVILVGAHSNLFLAREDLLNLVPESFG